jgi:hypothetical protein
MKKDKQEKKTSIEKGKRAFRYPKCHYFLRKNQKTKVCLTCGERKGRDDFRMDQKMRDGHLLLCNECQLAGDFWMPEEEMKIIRDFADKVRPQYEKELEASLARWRANRARIEAEKKALEAENQLSSSSEPMM